MQSKTHFSLFSGGIVDGGAHTHGANSSLGFQ